MQSFYGADPARIAACAEALCCLLKSNPSPAEWVFVEGQTSKNDCAFRWLRAYGVKHVFVKIGKAQERIFLERVLWNIGAAQTSAGKICFLDADILFRNGDWLLNVDRELDLRDVVQPFETMEREDAPGKKYVSLGKTLLNGTDFDKSCGHAGLGLAVTRKCFDMLKGFEPAVTLDDIWTWTRILGEDKFRAKARWMPCGLPPRQRKGLPVDVGYAENQCLHVGEVGGKYKVLTDIWKGRIDSLADLFKYDAGKPDALPEWNMESKTARAVRAAVCSAYSDKSVVDGNAAYFDAAERIYGKIDGGHQLVVCAEFEPSYQFRMKDFLERVRKFRKSCADDCIFVVFSDETGFGDEVDVVVPKDSEFNCSRPWMQCGRRDLEFPAGCSIVWLDQEDIIPEKFSFVRFDGGVRKFSELGNFIRLGCKQNMFES